jgi:hypothetical protein
MKLRKTLLAAAVVGAGALALSSLSASAAILCTGDVCWHSHDTYTYPPEAHVIVHEDSWKAGPHIRFREHEGRGYWRGETWTSW